MGSVTGRSRRCTVEIARFFIFIPLLRPVSDRDIRERSSCPHFAVIDAEIAVLADREFASGGGT
jgi:hypothetical protein